MIFLVTIRGMRKLFGEACPFFDLEDKVNLKRVGNGMEQAPIAANQETQLKQQKLQVRVQRRISPSESSINGSTSRITYYRPLLKENIRE